MCVIESVNISVGVRSAYLHVRLSIREYSFLKSYVSDVITSGP